MTFLHFDEAKPAGEKTLREWLANTPQVTKALMVGDLFGKLRLACTTFSALKITRSRIEVSPRSSPSARPSR